MRWGDILKLNELGFDFSNASSFVMRKKNRIASMVFSLLFLIFTFLLLVFLIMFLLKVPLNNNGTIINYGEPGYMSTFIILLSLFGGLSFLMLILLIIFATIKPKVYIIKSQDTSMNDFYYIYANKSELYLTKDRLLVYQKRFGRVDVETNKEKIDLAYDRYIFWEKFESLTGYVIKASNKKTILKFKERIGRIVQKASYKFENLGSVLPGKITEIVSYVTRGNNRIQSLNLYFIEDVNRSQTIDFPKEMLPYINQFN